MGRERSRGHARRPPHRGDRIELAGRRLGVSKRGTVHHVDDSQILVKWDDGRSQSLPRRKPADRFWLLEDD
jgi:hypothetical protein